MHTRYAIVGTGSRAEMFTRALTGPHATRRARRARRPRTAPARRAQRAARRRRSPTYHATEFRRMLHEEKVDVAIVTTVDRVHDDYIVAALEAGCDVITEKPMTIDAQRCAGSSTPCTRHRALHGHLQLPLLPAATPCQAADRRRRHRRVDLGALRVAARHRATAPTTSAAGTATRPTPAACSCTSATHHFDLVNWWLDDVPDAVSPGRAVLLRRGRATPGMPGLRRAHGTRRATIRSR